ncbi:MAG: universal stress protein [bacterium]
MIKKILVTTDCSDFGNRAVPFALDLGSQLGAEVVLCTVIEREKHESMYFIDWKPLSDRKNLQKAVNSARGMLKRVLPKGGAGGIKTSVKVIVDVNAVSGVINCIEELKPDLLVIAEHGMSGFQRFMMGSTADRIVRSVPCPVLILKTGDES